MCRNPILSHSVLYRGLPGPSSQKQIFGDKGQDSVFKRFAIVGSCSYVVLRRKDNFCILEIFFLAACEVGLKERTKSMLLGRYFAFLGNHWNIFQP